MEIFEFSFLSKVISVGRDSVKMELFNNNYPWSFFFLIQKTKMNIDFPISQALDFSAPEEYLYNIFNNADMLSFSRHFFPMEKNFNFDMRER